ncbi:hypothetical protein [Halorarum salinum]|uniref:Uncharacterized protein n=1 Tax=Halorarum salinum TaxID=2743089 RepID=A0A7D5QGL1_9EURY|nr:hypothetical protein [Halobaculum salinum]QLG62142.1 hypothetical protein HUG12_10525 [Halobaculum salinum]
MNGRTKGLVYLAVAALTLLALFALAVLPVAAPGLPFVDTTAYSFALLVLMVVAFPLLWVGGRRTMESLQGDLVEEDGPNGERHG